MRKISKISLVAAVAVAGLVSANAQPLEQAIKNVDVSGSVVYRYDNSHNDVSTSRKNTDQNKYKAALNLSSVVNEYVKFNSRFLATNLVDGDMTVLNAASESNTSNTAGGDGNVDLTLSQVYFGLTAIPNTVVTVGKQGLVSPWTVAVDATGNEQTGTGILALTTVGAVTAGAGYFNQQNLQVSGELSSGNLVTGGENVYIATLQGNLDFVKLEAWYLNLQDSASTYTLAATSKVDLAEDAKLGLEARYVDLKTDDRLSGVKEDKNSMFRFAVDGKFGIVNARLAYTKTGKKGGLTAIDDDSKNASKGWKISSIKKADADYYQAALGADILSNLNFTLHYGQLKSKNQDNAVLSYANSDNVKEKEIYGQLTYKMSKNLNTYVRYGKYTKEEVSTGKETVDQNAGRLQVAYTF